MNKGPNSTWTPDLFFDLSGVQGIKSQYTGRWSDYPDGILDMTELYGMKVYGEDITFGEKMVDSVRKYENLGTEDEPSYWAVPWATGFMGMTYNVDVFKLLYGENYEEKMPNTTDELYDLAVDIKSKGGEAFAFPGQIEYFSNAMFAVWWAQYEGVENYENFYRTAHMTKVWMPMWKVPKKFSASRAGSKHWKSWINCSIPMRGCSIMTDVMPSAITISAICRNSI